MVAFVLQSVFFGAVVHSQVSELLLECLCKQKNQGKYQRATERMLGMCVGHYNDVRYQKQCGSNTECLADAMNNGLGGVVHVSKCIR